jgi:crotonobetainyl-CoA:carnitine CoA-transferase CaiB-like acyl-CoA transferase
MPVVPQNAPLSGVRVIAIEQFGAGPWCTLQLASLGATVIKVEDPVVGGDVGRYVVPFQSDESSLFFETFNRGKQSVSLDLRNPAGRAVLHDLVRSSQVLFNNLRGDLPGKLGLTYASLADVNPHVVCCALSGFGTTGPRANQGAYDYAIQGHAGWMSLTGEPEGPPTRTGLSLVDFAGGFAAAIAILAGLRQAETTGRGCDCDVSLFEVALALNTYVATWALSAGWTPRRESNSAHPSVVPFQLFATRDGWIVICCAKESLFRRLCRAMDLEWMGEDARFSSLAARQQNREECVEILSDRLRELPSTEWITVLEAAGVPCGPVNDVATAFADEQVRAREAIHEYDHPELGTVRTAAPPIRVGNGPAPPQRGPFRGEHTRSVLRDLCGYSPEELDELGAAGAFGEAAAVW